VLRGQSTFLPTDETVLRAGDVVVGAVKDETYPKVSRYMEE
jgi:hypothetical protein